MPLMHVRREMGLGWGGFVALLGRQPVSIAAIR